VIAVRQGVGRAERVGSVAELKVGKLRLVAILPEMLVAEQTADYAELGRLLGARLTMEWPPEHWEPHVFRFMLKQFDEMPETLGWHRYVVLQDWLGRRTLVGAVGGFPKVNGEVEIGYSTLPEYQRRGFATAFAGALVGWLLGQEGVRCVSAQALEGVVESVKVMERCGMRFVGPGDDEGTVRYRVGGLG
jgi:ribosomal-protein-alanine N-acetyltransferase